MKKTAQKVTHSLHSLFVTSQTKHLHRKTPGQIPGTAVHTGARRVENLSITVHDFDTEHYNIIPIKTIEKSAPYLKSKSKTWIQVQGLHDIERLRAIWNYFELHPLIQEDIVNISQRPKVEYYSDTIFIVLRMITPKKNSEGHVKLQTEQISLVLGKHFVLSFQESDEPVFNPVRKRLELETSRLRKFGLDYLTYALMDTVVDHYFQALDLIGESIENVEEQIIVQPRQQHLQRIHTLRRDMIFLRKSVWSLRDGINSLIRDDSPLISMEVKVFLKDVYDHVVQVIDSIETGREMIYGLFDIYMSGLSNRMNEVMKVLTIIATIFIPLTFIAGIYGMNFDPEVSPFNMPELNWYYGYPLSLLLMALLTGSMLYFFKRKGWI